MPFNSVKTLSTSSIASKESSHNDDHPAKPRDLSYLLSELDLKFAGVDHYWQVGTSQATQGWIFHFSVVVHQLAALIKKIIPILVGTNTPFKIIRDIHTAHKILSDDYGFKLFGKLIAIYPQNNELAAKLALDLIELTREFDGPSILTDFCLANILYTRYGSFSQTWIIAPDGKPSKYIYNADGVLERDSCPIPFSFPIGIPWPFEKIAKPIVKKPLKLINARYYPISTVRESIKGNIVKAIYFKSLWSIKACILKQGRKNMHAEETGRNVSDRLHWQFEICKELLGVIPVPKIFDYFTENGDTYLAMEFVKGETIWNWLAALYKNRPWSDLSSTDKVSILNVLLQATDIIRRLHHHGFVHRDITPANFIITKRNTVIPIDLELSWSFRDKRPSIPFLLGTPGFMSAQQQNSDTPATEDDIYALGALLLTACTNMNPLTISKLSQSRLKQTLIFFTKDEQLSNLINDCLEDSPSSRPDITTIERTIKSSAEYYINESSVQAITTMDFPPEEMIRNIVQSAINGLSSSSFLGSEGQWITSAKQDISSLETYQAQQTSAFGWYTGIAGPLWVLAIAKSLGFNIGRCQATYTRNWDYIQKHLFDTAQTKDPSLFNGTAGIALALKEGIFAKLLQDDNHLLESIQTAFSSFGEDITLSRGISGQGLALLKISSALNPPASDQPLQLFINKIISSQNSDGSWELNSPDDRHGSVPLGLNKGIAGVLNFLISCLNDHSESDLHNATRKGLTWLISSKSNRHFWKRRNSSLLPIDLHSEKLNFDITFLMLKAFDALHDPEYKFLAEAYLRNLPQHLTSSNFTLYDGLAKIGDLYLEAFRILKNPYYWSQAAWISNVLFHTFVYTKKDEGHWTMLAKNQITANLFTGESGIIYYLLRYLHPKQVISTL